MGTPALTLQTRVHAWLCPVSLQHERVIKILRDLVSSSVKWGPMTEVRHSQGSEFQVRQEILYQIKTAQNSHSQSWLHFRITPRNLRKVPKLRSHLRPIKSESLENEGNSSFLKATPCGSHVRLILRTEQHICAHSWSSPALSRLILWHEFALLWLPSLLATGLVNVAETQGSQIYVLCFLGLQLRGAMWARFGQWI